MTLNLTELVKIAVVTEEGRAWPTFDGGNLTRWKFLSASEAAKCSRSLAISKIKDKDAHRVGLNTDGDYWSQFSDDEFAAIIANVAGNDVRGIFARGNSMEEWVVKQLRAVETDQEAFFFMGDDQVSFYHHKHRLSGTPDGIYVDYNSGEMWLLEFKSTQNPITTPRASYVTQVQVNMGLITALRSAGIYKEDLPAEFTGAKLFYVNTDNYLNLQEFDIPYDGGLTYNKMRAKAARLYDSNGDIVAPDELPPEGLKSGGCYMCDHKMQCAAIEEHKNDRAMAKKLREIIDRQTGGGDVPVMPTFAADTPRDEVVKLLAQYDQFSEDEKRAAAQKAALRDAIKVWLETQPDTKAEFEDDGTLFKVTLSKSTRAGSLNRDKVVALLTEMHKNVEEYVGPSVEVETLRVTAKRVQ